ncbi:MAG: HK97 family phage prohead protease [Flavobacteriales bacterium]
MKKTTFVLSSETINSYGFKVLTSGIDLKRFKDNPVMLLNHDKDKLIGSWEDIKVVDDKLMASPVFDTDDELGLSISNKVKNKFIKGASIGINVLEMDTSGRVPVAVKSEIFECSICPIPANSQALRVYDEKGAELSDEAIYTTLSLPFDNNNLAESLKSVLNLDSNATDAMILSTVRELQEKPVLEFLNKAISQGQVLHSKKGYFLDLLIKDFETTKEVIEAMPKRKKLSTLINKKEKYPKEWTLKDYRKHAPEYLRKNKDFYKELVDKEYNQNN